MAPNTALRGAFEGLAIRPVRCAGHRDDDRRHRPGSWPIRGRRPVAGASEDLPQLSTAADTLGGQNAPLTSTPADALSATSTVLSVLEPATVVNQVLGVATGVSALDVPGILRKLTVLPQKVAAPDAHGAHQVAGELYNQFSPLVKMAAVVDLCWVSQILSVIPDPRGHPDRCTRCVDPGERRRYPIGHPGRADPGNRLDRHKGFGSVAARRRADPAFPGGIPGAASRRTAGPPSLWMHVGMETVSGHRTGTTASMRWSPTSPRSLVLALGPGVPSPGRRTHSPSRLCRAIRTRSERRRGDHRAHDTRSWQAIGCGQRGRRQKNCSS